MKSNLTKIAIAAAFAASMALAQTQAPTAPAPHNHMRARMQHGRQMMMQQLNLSDAQKAQAKAIFQKAHQDAAPVREQLKQTRMDLRAAVKADDTAKIQTLTAQEGTLIGKAANIRSAAMADFYKTLTADQRTKLDSLHKAHQQKMQSHKG